MVPRWLAGLVLVCLFAWLVLNPASLGQFITTVFTSVGVFFRSLG